MKTDALLYDLFQTFPALFFELIGQNPALAEQYRFDALEVKQIAFRLDGVFIPNDPGQPLYFLECQFQKDPAIYLRMIAQIAMYFRREHFAGNWQAVVLFARRSMDPGIPQSYGAFEGSGQIQRFYLEDHQGNQGSLAFRVLGLLNTPQRQLKAKVEQLLPKVRAEILDPDRREQIIEMLETVLIAKFPKLSRQEIEVMLKVKSLRNTRVFQEGVEEGRQEGRRTAAREILLRQLTLKFGHLDAQVVSQIQTIAETEKLERLADALINAPDLQGFQQHL